MVGKGALDWQRTISGSQVKRKSTSDIGNDQGARYRELGYPHEYMDLFTLAAIILPKASFSCFPHHPSNQLIVLLAAPFKSGPYRGLQSIKSPITFLNK